MTKTWVPPRPRYHLRIFAACLAVLFATLAGILFGVQLDATVAGAGIFVVRDRTTIHAPASGSATLGWFETTFMADNGTSFPARLDAAGNGHVQRDGTLHEVVHLKCAEDLQPQSTKLTFHPLESGDVLWAGQLIGTVSREPVAEELKAIRSEMQDWNSPEAVPKLLKRLDALESRWTKPVRLFAPKDSTTQVLSTISSEQQHVHIGDKLVDLATIDSEKHASRLIAQIDVAESAVGELTNGQIAYLRCATHQVRLYGKVKARIAKVASEIHRSHDGKRVLRVWADVIDAPFELRPGVTFDASIVVGRKPVYRVILER